MTTGLSGGFGATYEVLDDDPFRLALRSTYRSWQDWEADTTNDLPAIGSGFGELAR
ncbi:MAG: hypothetical protein R2748_33685 [Bryobacterales bacterium]